MNLEDVLAKAKENEDEFKVIYDLTIRRVFSYVLLRTRDKGEALDICQEIYLSFWRSLPSFVYMGDGHFYSFLFTVARRQIIKVRIKQKDTVDIEEIFDIEAEEPEKEDYRFLIKQLGRLKDKERLCVELRHFEDMSFAQIGESMGIKENNAKVLHYRAMRKLKELMPDYE